MIKPTDVASPTAPNKESSPWSALIRDLLKQLEIPHKGITLSRKKEGVETVLTKFANKPDELHEKLRGLIRSWSSAPTSSAASTAAVAPAVHVAAIAPILEPAPSGTTDLVAAASALNVTLTGAETDINLSAQLRELLAQTLESLLHSQPEFTGEIQVLVQQVRATLSPDQLTRLAKQLRQFWLKLELRGGDNLKIQEGLLRLLRLLVGNVGDLVAEDEWLHGQIAALKEIIDQPPDKRMIADAERNLRDAVIKQGLLKHSLTDAKSTLKSLMTTFIDRLGELTESTSEYHTKIDNYSTQIGGTDNLTELSHILNDIMYDTQVIQASALRSHEELLHTRKQAHDAEERVHALEHELGQVSELVYQDQLTGALNRRGLDELLARETNRADRQQSPLSVALLDIDNFKQLNDNLGHQAGDQALIHITKIIRETLRPTDAVARYGGEEFLIILADTKLNDAVDIITRLQRELTKKFFLHENNRLLITFSAGIALRHYQEDAAEVVRRADTAMYQVKKSGKNRVLAAE